MAGKTAAPEFEEEPEEIKDQDRESLLVVILDSNPSQRKIREDPNHLTQVLEAVIAFSNAHLLQRVLNRVAILSCHHHTTEFLFPLPGTPLEVRITDGQLEEFARVEQTAKQRLSDIICNAPKLTAVVESLLAGSMAMGLSYIQRLQQREEYGECITSRMLVITGSPTCAAQYTTYLNVFFTAQKMNVVIDVCSLDSHLGLLQQGVDITGGQYLNPPQLEGLLQYMLWVFLPDPHTRPKLVLPPPQRIDYRAACFCHRELIDIGYVCSTCLSIFCKFTPICTTCQTPFKLPIMMKNKRKRSKHGKTKSFLK